MVTPLGDNPVDVLARIREGHSAAQSPRTFEAGPFFCPHCAEIADFDAHRTFPENKSLRMMNRDAQLAVVAARRAIENAQLKIGTDYFAEDVALFGATGMAGIPLDDIRKLVDNAAGDHGQLDLHRFGREALKRVRPVLSFKILANMPICFVSIFENIQGPNAVYTPWEGQGARAIQAGILAVRSGRANCAVVGGCDTKANLLGFIALQQHGLFDSWQTTGEGTLPGEGAAFLILEEESRARSRGVKIVARLTGHSMATKDSANTGKQLAEMAESLGGSAPGVIMGSADKSTGLEVEECALLGTLDDAQAEILFPKVPMGNLFAAGAAVQVGLAAEACRSGSTSAWANCIGHGSEMGVFGLEAV